MGWKASARKKPTKSFYEKTFKYGLIFGGLINVLLWIGKPSSQQWKKTDEFAEATQLP